jgi:hypothetical protein
MTAPTGSPESVRPQIRFVVRANRLRCWSIAIIGLPLTFVLIMLDPGGVNSTADDLTRAAGFASMGLAHWSRRSAACSEATRSDESVSAGSRSESPADGAPRPPWP